MKRAIRLAAVLIVVTAAGSAGAQKPKADPAAPAGSAKMGVVVELTGLLKVTEKGAEVTFTGSDYNDQGIYLTQTFVWQLDLSRSARLRKKAVALDGKEVVIEGTARVWIREHVNSPYP